MSQSSGSVAHYYRNNAKGLSLSEAWHVHSLLGLVGHVISRWCLAQAQRLPMVRPTGVQRLTLEQLPVEARQRIAATVAELAREGLSLCFAYRMLPINPFNTQDESRGLIFVDTDARF